MQNCKTGQYAHGRAKIIRLMKWTAFLLLGGCLQVAASGFSQDTELTISEKQIKLNKFFKLLEKKTDYHFSYSSNFIPLEARIDVEAENEKFSSLLKRVLRSLQLDYKLVDERLVVIVALNRDSPPLPADTLINVKGRVRDNAGNPVAGATIQVKNDGKSVVSNDNGQFVLNAIPRNSVLIVTNVSYETQEIAVMGRTDLLITLSTRIVALEDVVVTTGIYQRPVENFTGVALSFSDSDLRRVSNRNALDAVKALDPSFRIPENISFGSDPNQIPQIQIRGANSLPNTETSNSTEVNLRGDFIDNPNLPLFILDGFEVSVKRIYDLDMNMIAQITLLKDAAATAIYGSRAANGVVIVETKQPEKGKLQLNYNSNFTYTLPDLTSYHLLNAEQKLELERVSGVYFDEYLNSRHGFYELYHQRLAEVSRGVNSYWLSQPLRNSFGHKHNIYVGGGDDYMRYGADFSYNNDNNGVMKGSGRSNYSGGVNLLYRYKKISVRNYFSFVANKATRSPYGSFTRYAELNPYWRVRDSMGNIPKVLEEAIGMYGSPYYIYNPMYDATLNTRNETRYLNLSNNTVLQWDLNSDFKIRGRFSIYTQRDHYEKFLPAEAIKFAEYTGSNFYRRGEYSESNGEQLNFQGDLTINYGRNIGKNVLYGTAGFQFLQDTYKSSGMNAVGFPNQNLDNIGFAYAYEVDGKPYGNETIRRTAGFLANASYAYDNKYLFDLSVRTDGSSQFGANKRFGLFWSVGAGWNLHKESFIAEMFSKVNRLRLRASFGSTGSQNFPSYLALQSYRYVPDQQYRSTIGATLMGLGNPNLQWQQNYKTNLGADIDLYQSRLAVRGNYYIERTNSLITSLSTPPSQGFSSYRANLGNIENKGVELYLTGVLVKKDKQGIRWSVNTGIFHNKNRILSISESLKEQNDLQREKSSSSTKPVLLLEEGKSQTGIYAVRSLGIDPSNGYEIYVKRDGSLTYTWDPLDQVLVGDAAAKVYGTIGTDLLYKGFSMNVVFRASLGGDMYNQTLADRVENANLTKNVDIRVLEERWQKPGDVTLYKGVVDMAGKPRTDVTRATSRFVQKNNTIYCDAITLGYEFNNAFVNKLSMRYLRLNFYMNNLFTISCVKQERGLDYPFARTYSLSLQTSF
ncbi:MAG TPA: SusC/RagA family TonB-linked outer membrane protein [Parasegetibacter sp.]